MRLIDMDSLWQCETCFHHKSYGCDTWCDAGEAYRPSASKLKVIDPESLRKKGEWITVSFWKTRKGHHVQLVFKKCSLCNIRVKARLNNNFCPSCGADMRGNA